eukprot:6001373-Pyramimonas_sp.AAC.1
MNSWPWALCPEPRTMGPKPWAKGRKPWTLRNPDESGRLQNPAAPSVASTSLHNPWELGIVLKILFQNPEESRGLRGLQTQNMDPGLP